MKEKSDSSTKVIDMLPYIKVYYDFQENDIRNSLSFMEKYFLSWLESSPDANQFYNYEQYYEIIPNLKTSLSLVSFRRLVTKLSKLGVIDIEKNKNNLSRFKIYSFDKTQLENKHQEQKDSSMPKTNFIAPTLNEIMDYANEFITNSNKYYVPDLDTECESFFDYYSNTDWKICQGRQKMKDWKLALHNWLRNASNRNQRFNRPRQYGQYNGFMTKQEYISESNRKLHEEWLKQRQEQQANQQPNQQEQSNNVLTYDWLFTGNNK